MLNYEQVTIFVDRTLLLKFISKFKNPFLSYLRILAGAISLIILLYFLINKVVDVSFVVLISILFVLFTVPAARFQNIPREKQIVLVFLTWIVTKFVIFATFIVGGILAFYSGRSYGIFFTVLGLIWIPSVELIRNVTCSPTLLLAIRWLTTLVVLLVWYQTNIMF